MGMPTPALALTSLAVNSVAAAKGMTVPLGILARSDLGPKRTPDWIWYKLEEQLASEHLQQGVFLPGLTFRMHNCAGKPHPVAERAYTAKAVLASNMLIGSRAQTNIWDYMRHAQAMSKRSTINDVATLVAN